MTGDTVPSAPTPPFDNVPVEILDRIFSFVPMCPPLPPKPALSLLHVSRQFRHVALRSKFWLEPEFVFEDLISTSPHLWYSATSVENSVDQARRVAGLCSALFRDPYFAQCLQLKTAWRFVSPGPFVAALAFLPSFPNTIRRISLYEPELSTITRLSACHNLEELLVSAPTSPMLDLSALFAHTPARVRRVYVRFDGPFIGSMHDLVGIEELTLNSFGCTSHAPNDLLMPMASAETLTRLSIEYVDPKLVSIDAFINLKHLRTKAIMGESLLAILKDFEGSLETLYTHVMVYRNDLLEVNCDFLEWMEWKALALPCLSHLKTLRLQVIHDCMEEYRATYVSCCAWLIEVIASRMPDLEDVTLWAGLDLSKASVVKRLNQLRSLQWNVPPGYKIKGRRSENEDLNSRLLEYFRQLDRLPSVKVQVGGFQNETVDLLYETGPFEWI